jgi:hypothetical protein
MSYHIGIMSYHIGIMSYHIGIMSYHVGIMSYQIGIMSYHIGIMVYGICRDHIRSISYRGIIWIRGTGVLRQDVGYTKSISNKASLLPITLHNF